MSGHTPGPWRDEAITARDAARMRGPEPQDFMVIGSDGTVVGVLYDYFEVTTPNARLIAAAPDLLDALKRIDALPSELAGEAWAIARAAIAKAEGK